MRGFSKELVGVCLERYNAILVHVDKTTDKNTWPLIMYRMAFSFCRAWFSDLFIYQFHLSLVSYISYRRIR